ncbi:hypothetical protein GCM10010975_32760 [Comamonas phosphati]|nr:hypothetical protein GCM10010975_32760 [Comamonas phosphati]
MVQHPLTDPRQARGKIDGGGGLAHATFLIGYTEDFGHEIFLCDVVSSGATTDENVQFMREALRTHDRGMDAAHHSV